MADLKWLFEGVGGLIVVTLGSWLISLRKGRRVTAPPAYVELQRASATAAPPGSSSSDSAVTYAEIEQAIDNAPPLHREEVAARFVGLRIHWETTLHSASLSKTGRIELVLPIAGTVLAHVVCEVSRAEYPQLSILLKGAPMDVAGKITRVRGTQIYLDDVSLSFPRGDREDRYTLELIASSPSDPRRSRSGSGNRSSSSGAPSHSAFADMARIFTEGIPLPDLRAATMSEVGTKLDLARAYIDMGDKRSARSILQEVLTEGSKSQKDAAQELLDSLKQ